MTDWLLERQGPRKAVACDHTTCTGCSGCECHRKPAQPSRGTAKIEPKLVPRNAEQWKLLRADIEAVLKAFEQCERELVDRARAAYPDGFPAGGSGGGRSSDVSDSTFSAVLARAVQDAKDPAVRAILTFNAALRTLQDAEKHRVDAFPPPPKVPEPDGWCVSCLRIRWHSPVDTNKKWSQPNPYCSFCSGWRRDPGFLPPVWVLRKHARGDRMYDVDVQKAIADEATRAAETPQR